VISSGPKTEMAEDEKCVSSHLHLQDSKLKGDFCQMGENYFFFVLKALPGICWIGALDT
jgi:hypothetical protein